jgi:hypothetical protein
MPIYTHKNREHTFMCVYNEHKLQPLQIFFCHATPSFYSLNNELGGYFHVDKDLDNFYHCIISHY